jgi:DNA-binding MarR family transcriptional regulator
MFAVLALCEKGGRTVYEIAARLERRPHTVLDRLRELRAAKYVTTKGTHDGAPIWVATEAGKAAAASPPPDPRTVVRGGALDLLSLIAAEPGLCAADAAKKLKRNQAGVTSVAHRLEAKGLVSVEYDGRRQNLRITAAGLAEIGGGG